jgi:hypothetical protein
VVTRGCGFVAEGVASSGAGWKTMRLRPEALAGVESFVGVADHVFNADGFAVD